jgi:CRISPR/Cas system CSM-associated protein Csm3 (group 7 of RAMP superfamily)
MMHLQTKEKITKFKNKTMMAFEGSFTSNARLPDLIGLGKSTARGYGTITYNI